MVKTDAPALPVHLDRISHLEKRDPALVTLYAEEAYIRLVVLSCKGETSRLREGSPYPNLGR